MQFTTRTIVLAYLAVLVSPLFFSTNIIFGRAAQELEPFTLAWLRWSLSALVLLAVSRPWWSIMADTFRKQFWFVMGLGFLGMWICGALVYWALKETTAVNGTLIYTTPPLIIILIEWLLRGRAIGIREISGMAIAFIGVGVIVFRGSLEVLFNFSLNWGDLVFVAAAISWALYSVLLKAERLSHLPTLPLFALVAFAGSITLLPFAAFEIFAVGGFPHSTNHWLIIGGIVLLSSLIAFSTFQHGIRILGAPIASVFMYLLPPFGIGLAWLFLGEALKPFHLAGTAFVLTGVVVATFPTQLLRR